ncbi:MAG TPA: radical SAM protein [Thermodesulfovibrionales bacterium]|nr:radical SAM protein [Thermodesulfovibrionales bacterium]
MSAELNNMDKSFDVQVPWIIDEYTELTLTIHDRQLLGSKRYFIRFDMYPLYAPSHMKRHHGFWDIPLEHIKRERTVLTFKRGKLIVKDGWRSVHVNPAWKGDLEFIGYSMLHISLWDSAENPPSQLTVKSSQHMIRPGKQDLPLEHVFLPVTERCNINCRICIRRNPENWEAVDVTPEVLMPVFEASSGVHSMLVGGIGELLLYQNLYGVITELKRRMPEDSQVGFTTNGTLMTKHTAPHLIDIGVDWICFSVDGAFGLTYERIRLGADFDAVIKNIADTVEYGKASGGKKPWLMANYVIQQENAHEIPAFIRLAGSLGLNAVTFSHLRDYKTGEFRVLEENLLRPLFDQAAEAGDKYGLIITFPLLRPLDEPKCPFMQSAYLWLTGEVAPCCRMLKGACSGPIKIFGNVRERPLLDIWNSADYRVFRYRVLNGDFPEECINCEFKTYMAT